MSKIANSPVEIPGLDVARAKRYSRVRLSVLAISTLWSLARLAWVASDRRALRLRGAIAGRAPDRRLVAPAFFAVVTLGSWLVNLPLAYVGGYLVERRFALSNQSGRSWLADRLKGLVLSILLQTPLLTLVYNVIRRRPRDWWLVLASAAVPLSVMFSYLAPVLLMPVFNRFVPLRDQHLADRLHELADRSGVSISDVFEMDMSRQSEKPNATFTGIGRTKRIVLGDSMLERFTAEEIEAVVAHEVGHQAHGDIWRLIGFSTSAGFGLAWLMFQLAPPLLRRTSNRTGVDDVGNVASLPVLAILMTVIGALLMPIQAAFSRAIERNADRYAVNLTGDGEAYASALEKLAAQSLSDPDPPRPVVLLLYSHPPIAERIRSARGIGAVRSGPVEP